MSNLKDKVYKGIYDDVTNGILKQNDILTESRLAEKYNVSKSPVRDALVALCKDDILRSIPRMGYQVIPVSLNEIMNVVDLRVDIETSGLRRAAGKIYEREISELERIAELSMENNYIAADSWSKNYEFHTYLYSLNGNEFALKYLAKLIRQSATYIAQYFISAWGRQREQDGRLHMEILNAIKQNEIEKACELLKEDIESVKEEISALYGWQ